LLTGSDDGIIRVWIPHKTICEETLKGHSSAITHIKTHPQVRRFVSLSEDRNIYVWSEYTWVCLQSLPVQYMNLAPISSMCYNTFNNEVVLANSNISKCLGRGTEAYESTYTSHDSLLCGLLYHSTYKQVVSACINGTVAVWDFTSGKLVMEFKVTSDHFRRLTAIAFDGPQRRLITADRKLRLWNFNNGAQLKVLSVTIPNEVCIRNRVFVSQMDSNIIYNLDINGDDNIFLENPYANGISSINIHKNKLVTALTNGEIIVWNVDTSKAIFSLNPRMSPQIQMIYHSHEEKMRTVVLFLKTREVNANTATLLTSAGGHLYACSVISHGGLLGRFKAVKKEGAVITTMTTDANEQILLTGDNTGTIYMWNIQIFGFRRISLYKPDLLRSWQCHLFGIVNVQCDPVCKYIITTGFDCNVQVWRDNGSPLGTLGKNQWE
uniref:WD repeat-containing protein on Y chromosome n=1 Tax=Tetraodon nigroviridis TaxID=99883 RepID=H3DMR1_TETNG